MYLTQTDLYSESKPPYSNRTEKSSTIRELIVPTLHKNLPLLLPPSLEKESQIATTKTLHLPFLQNLQEKIYKSSTFPPRGEAGNLEMDAILYQILLEELGRSDLLILSYNPEKLVLPQLPLPSHIRYIVAGCYVNYSHAVAVVIDRYERKYFYFDPLFDNFYKKKVLTLFTPLLDQSYSPADSPGTLQNDHWSCIYHAIENIVSRVTQKPDYRGKAVDGHILESKYKEQFTKFVKIYGT
ncbi:MAG: hypothetical protein JWO53_186 [Chlamydiia bacterium]|nr:hypothetical protein [Chlamydiia bacterium]